MAAPAQAALIQAALGARDQAYAPYSHFSVGAAVMARDGRIFAGVNVENASYPLTVCAERNAIAAAVLAGARELVAVAVATAVSPPSAPCGGCRQVIAEFARETTILLVNPEGERVETTLGELLPRAFRGEELAP
ncbi:MAG TPA: cytidine deaminase [Polyangia bacterium]|nr:cytidine deaminase [Polyangia bacterium]